MIFLDKSLVYGFLCDSCAVFYELLSDFLRIVQSDAIRDRMCEIAPLYIV